MVTFTTTVFLVAVLNIYKVSKAKLQVQNLADAAALNIADQIASSMNKEADLNESMNHFLADAPNVQPSQPGDIPNCAADQFGLASAVLRGKSDQEQSAVHVPT